MNPSHATPSNAQGMDILARAFLATLAYIERKKKERRDNHGLEVADADDAVEKLVAASEGKRKTAFVPLRADLAAVAVLVARAIETEPGLVNRLRREAPVLTVATHSSDVAALVDEVFRLCAFPKGTLIQELTLESANSMRQNRAILVVRDGANKLHRAETGNDLVGGALHSRVPLVGIAPDPTKDLPRDLTRAAEAKLSLPAFDAGALSLVIEAVVGAMPTRLLDDVLVRTLDVGDLSVALGRCSSPDEALDAVAKVLAEKSDYLHGGLPLRDLHGYGDARDWGLALSQDLDMYRSGRLAWCDVDARALLLTGPPGAGKTSFARAVAKECRVPLIATSVAEWNAAEYLHGTLKRIREAFASARSRAPCILFIDELDGISDRAKLRGDYVQYWSQIVNYFLELLSGIEALEGVIVIAATNYPDLIDSAVKRAGRLDREIEIRKPDIETLAAIFGQYLEGDIETGAAMLPLALAARGGTGADVEAWVRRARGAARRAGREVRIDDVLAEIRSGRPPLPDAVRRRIAIHEAGHVVVGDALGCGKVLALSLHDRGGEAWLDTELAGDATAEQVEAVMAMSLAGRAAEKLALGAPSIGAGNGEISDLRRATQLAHDLELRYGMGLLGPVQVETHPNDLVVMRGLLDAVSSRVRAAEARAKEVLQTRWSKVEAIAAALELKGYLAGGDVAAVLGAPSPEEALRTSRADIATASGGTSGDDRQPSGCVS